jgi:signal transduction histidine kinase
VSKATSSSSRSPGTAKPQPTAARPERISRPRSMARYLRSLGATLRFRLTVLYGTLFAAAGAMLLAITYALVDHASSGDAGQIVAERVSGSGGKVSAVFSVRGSVIVTGKKTPLSPAMMQEIAEGKAIASAQRADVLRRLLEESGIALGIVTVMVIAVGYLLARRSLRPVRVMAAKAHAISEANLHERLAVTGPVDELKQLGDTFDGMLARIEGAFTAQRNFVANASHELRTPMTYQRTLLELAIDDAAADAETLRETCRRALRTGLEQERLVEALLTLARSQRGLSHREPVDLAEAAGEVVEAARLTAPDPSVRIDLQAGPAVVAGEPHLLRRLVSNLVDNAVRYNSPGGQVTVSSWSTPQGGARLRVVNTGRTVPDDKVQSLFEPFQRLDGRAADHDGLGLGLSIVAATAEAHGGRLHAAARPRGGLDITVDFPAPDPAPDPAMESTPSLS